MSPSRVGVADGVVVTKACSACCLGWHEAAVAPLDVTTAWSVRVTVADALAEVTAGALADRLATAEPVGVTAGRVRAAGGLLAPDSLKTTPMMTATDTAS